MYLDSSTIFSSDQAITVTAPSTNVIDLAGLGVGQAVTNKFGTASVFGEDIGIGDGVSPPVLAAIVGTAFTAAGAATLQVQLEAAIDDGTGNPSTWEVLAETDGLAKALLTAGQKIAEFTVPPRYPGQGFPRFYRLNYVVATGPMTAGTIKFAGVVTGRDDVPFYPSAF
jgi:hypothetical protein